MPACHTFMAIGESNKQDTGKGGPYPEVDAEVQGGVGLLCVIGPVGQPQVHELCRSLLFVVCCLLFVE